MTIQTELFGQTPYGYEPTGAKLRDEGINKVSSHNDDWIDKCIVAFQSSILRHDFTGEDVRLFCSEYVGEPKHPNAWGALTNTLVKRKIIESTGEYRTPRDKTSHARKIQVYRRTKGN